MGTHKIKADLDVDGEVQGTSLDINGNADISGNLVFDGNTITGINDSGEFDDDDSHIMTSAAINDRFAQINANTTGSSGSCTGNAATATSATSATTATNANNVKTTSVSNSVEYFGVFVDANSTSFQDLHVATGLKYNPSTDVLSSGKYSSETVDIVENAKSNAACMTITGAGAGTEANIGLKIAGTVHGSPIKLKMTAENDDGTGVGTGMLSFEPDDDTFNIGQSTTHGRMGISIANTNTIGSSDVIYQEDVTIKSRLINMTANANHFEFNGDVIKVGNDATTRGKLYHYKSGTWTLADKDAEADADGLLAMAIGENSTNDGMLLRGTMTLDYDPGNAGDPLYVGDSGVIQNSAPSGSGDIVRIVGYLLGGAHGNILFDPDKTFVEVA